MDIPVVNIINAKYSISLINIIVLQIVTKYDVKFGNRIVKNIPTEMLEVVELKEHPHEATEEDDEGKDDE